MNCRWLFPASRFEFLPSCREGKGSYKKAGRTNAGLSSVRLCLGAGQVGCLLGDFQQRPGKCRWSITTSGHICCEETGKREHPVLNDLVAFHPGNWNSISRLPWTCWRSHWLCWFCSCSRSWAVCRGRVPAWLTVAAGSTTAANRSWLCCGSILGFPKDSLEQQPIRCPSNSWLSTPWQWPGHRWVCSF